MFFCSWIRKKLKKISIWRKYVHHKIVFSNLADIQDLRGAQDKDPFAFFCAWTGIHKFSASFIHELAILYYNFIFLPLFLKEYKIPLITFSLNFKKKKERLYLVHELTGPRYLMHCCWSFDLGHFSSRFTSFPSPTSNLYICIKLWNSETCLILSW